MQKIMDLRELSTDMKKSVFFAHLIDSFACRCSVLVYVAIPLFDRYFSL